MSKRHTETTPQSAAIDPRRNLPAVDQVLRLAEMRSLLQRFGRPAVKSAVREVLDSCRRDGQALPDASAEVAERIEQELQHRFGPSIRRVINATGVLVHTNLGRSPLPPAIANRLGVLADAYCDLEFDLETGKRGDRNQRVEALLQALTGAAAGLVVNNNAAAVLLALASLAKGKEVLLSRGEMVEIGGTFRIPEILAASGARLVEVGTTNRTHLRDYQNAITEDTAAILKVHPSNYRIEGFTQSSTPGELVALAGDHNLKVIIDEGSGLLTPSQRPQLHDHDSLAELVSAGVDLACGSGDKALGGPQAGILVGQQESIAACRHSPLYRALRPSRLTLVSLRLVLEARLRGDEFPIDRLWSNEEELAPRLEALRNLVGGEIVVRDGYIGGGAAAQRGVPGPVLVIPGGAAAQEKLRRGDPPVVAYVRDEGLHVDLRTVDPADDDDVARALSNAL